MAIQEQEIVTSTGKIGEVEKRSYGRVYLSDDKLYSDFTIFSQRWTELNREANEITPNSNERRRIVLRTFITQSVLNDIISNLDSGLTHHSKIEALYPMSDVDGAEGEYMIMLAQNNHASSFSSSEKKRLEIAERESLNRNYDDKIVHRIASLPEGYSLSYQLKPDDYQNLLQLWQHNFEWSSSGIEAFAQKQGSDGLWFCGVRDSGGELVAASMAEAVIFRDQWFTELTEWAASVKGVSSTMVIALIARVLDSLYYGSRNTTPILIAEMNLHHIDNSSLGAPGTGLSSGLRLPTLNASSNYNTLRHNVLVGSGRKDKGHKNLNNFAFGILSSRVIATMYPENAVKEVVNQIKSEET